MIPSLFYVLCGGYAESWCVFFLCMRVYRESMAPLHSTTIERRITRRSFGVLWDQRKRLSCSVIIPTPLHAVLIYKTSWAVCWGAWIPDGLGELSPSLKAKEGEQVQEQPSSWAQGCSANVWSALITMTSKGEGREVGHCSNTSASLSCFWMMILKRSSGELFFFLPGASLALAQRRPHILRSI